MFFQLQPKCTFTLFLHVLNGIFLCQFVMGVASVVFQKVTNINVQVCMCLHKQESEIVHYYNACRHGYIMCIICTRLVYYDVQIC